MTDKVIRIPPKLFGRKLSNAELDDICATLESMDSIDAVTPEVRKLIEAQWPHLAAKLSPGR